MLDGAYPCFAARRWPLAWAKLALLVALTACSDEADGVGARSQGDGPSSRDDAGGGGIRDGGLGSSDVGADLGDVGSADGGVLACADLEPPPCQDEAFGELGFQTDPSDGVIVEQGAFPGASTYIDATAGGLQATESFVYARFTASGLEKVELDDEQALEDTSWHIAFRRYVIRLNGGVSGPSCVRGARTPPGTDYESVSEVSPLLSFSEEAYFTDSCAMIPDGSGLMRAPATVLSSFWTYPGCVQMTGNVFVLDLADGRFVKLEVLSYYEADRQQQCQDTGQVSLPSGSGNVRIRWAFL